MDNSKKLFVFALEAEAQNMFDEYNVLYTGIGKVNAAYSLTKSIAQNRPDIIINLGSAGSSEYNIGTVVCCTQFIQKDMDATALRFEKYQTPFSEIPITLKNGINVENFPLGICGSGDHFDTSGKQDVPYNVSDMEAYALALIAFQENIPFLCLKYITDGADGKAAEDWNITVNKAAQSLKDAINYALDKNALTPKTPPVPGYAQKQF